MVCFIKTNKHYPFIHPISTAYLGLGHRGSSQSREAHTFLIPATSSSSGGDTEWFPSTLIDINYLFRKS